jgi:hypothetical protein
MPGKAENGEEIVGNDFKQPQAGPSGRSAGMRRVASAIYTGVNAHFESFSNAERRRPSVFQQTARTMVDV